VVCRAVVCDVLKILFTQGKLCQKILFTQGKLCQSLHESMSMLLLVVAPTTLFSRARCFFFGL
jgi:hypothetical protein